MSWCILDDDTFYDVDLDEQVDVMRRNDEDRVDVEHKRNEEECVEQLNKHLKLRKRLSKRPVKWDIETEMTSINSLSNIKFGKYIRQEIRNFISEYSIDYIPYYYFHIAPTETILVMSIKERNNIFPIETIVKKFYINLNYH